MITITQKLLPVPSQRRSGLKLDAVKFIVCHDTANDGATALNNVNYYIQSANDMQASAHAFVDANGVIECIPLTEKAWHVNYGTTVDNKMFGFDANDDALAVELCYSTKGLFDSKKAYNNYVEYIRGLCQKYGLDPRTKLVAHGTLDPARRSDPFNAFSKIGKTWQNFIDDVAGPAVEEMVSVQIPKSKVDKVLAFLKTI
jgi:N-acetylmuramoyl-L-alanine amidase CwlA